jgi:transcriptional regulator of acetoin/glycerol metabolism
MGSHMALQRAHVCPNCGHQLPDQYLQLSLKEALAAFERDYLVAQLARHDGNAARMAKAIKLERSSVYRTLRRFGLCAGRERGRPADELRPAA